MSFTVLTAEQRSDEWRRARIGRVTGSCAKDMLATIKSGGEAADRRDLRIRLVCERLTGASQEDSYVSKEMQRGIDREAEARGAYEAATGRLVRTTGFLSHDTLMAGCSLDGDVGNCQGIIEIKVPKSATHLKYLRSGAVPPEHQAQITHNLWMTGARWADFVSWDDRFPAELQLLVIRVERDEKAIKAYELLLRQFLGEVERECEELLARIAKVA